MQNINLRELDLRLLVVQKKTHDFQMLKIDKILLDVKQKIDIVFFGIKKNKKKIHDRDMRCGKL